MDEQLITNTYSPSLPPSLPPLPQNARTALDRAQIDSQQMLAQLIKWCKAHYGEAMTAWMHVKVGREGGREGGRVGGRAGGVVDDEAQQLLAKLIKF
jgi:hypothetical protein